MYTNCTSPFTTAEIAFSSSWAWLTNSLSLQYFFFLVNRQVGPSILKEESWNAIHVQQESILLAQWELERVELAVEATEKNPAEKLPIKMQQKYIKVANHPDYIWGAVHHYQADPLADNKSDNEKQLCRDNKKTKKDFKEQTPTAERQQMEAGMAEGVGGTSMIFGITQIPLGSTTTP